MNFHPLDTAIILGYLILTVALGFYFSKKASKDLKSYFLGGNEINWRLLGLSNASGMFDVSGVMWSVSLLFVYGLKSAWIPWLWPVWNQVFVMVFMAIWLRRSNVMTGAEWITHRFGDTLGARLSHIIVTVFAVISVFGFIAYFFVGIGKFATIFFPWDLSLDMGSLHFTSEQMYALVIIGLTSLYVIKGGMYSVVITEVLQFVIMTISCLVVGYIAFTQTTHADILANVPDGWDQLFTGWRLDLNWQEYLPSVNDKIEEDGFELFGYLLMMMIFKGIFASMAGPVPSYDMQRVLSTKTPKDAAKMSGYTILVLFFPRYLMIAGFGALTLVYLMPEFQAMGADLDFEVILPMAIERFVPIGFKGLLLAGLLAAFMGTFAAFINAAPAYIVNDIYKKYINPDASDKKLVRFSYASSLSIVLIGIVIGLFADSINSLTLWISSALYGGYAAANVLKWVWWRFNGFGYFFGMLSGLAAATIIPWIYPDVIAIYLFPWILFCSMFGCIVATFMTPAESDDVLVNFYTQTYPWGLWQPVVKKLREKNPNYIANPHFSRDSINIIAGVIWQMTLVIMPIYLVIKSYDAFFVSLGIFVVMSLILYNFWYKRLDLLSKAPAVDE